MYVFLLTVSFMCREQLPQVATDNHCDSIWLTAFPNPEIASSVRGYFATEEGCLAAASEEMKKEAAVSAQLAKSEGAFLRNPHIDCRPTRVKP